MVKSQISFGASCGLRTCMETKPGECSTKCGRLQKDSFTSAVSAFATTNLLRTTIMERDCWIEQSPHSGKKEMIPEQPKQSRRYFFGVWLKTRAQRPCALSPRQYHSLAVAKESGSNDTVRPALGCCFDLRWNLQLLTCLNLVRIRNVVCVSNLLEIIHIAIVRFRDF